MRTYRELFRTPEYTALFFASSAQVAAGTVSGLALGTLVWSATGSPLLSALSMFGPSFAQVIGATMLMSAADRVPPRAALVTVAAALGAGTLTMAIPGLPIAGMFAVLLVMGLVGSVGGGVRYGLLGEILPPDGYVLGRSVLNMSVGATQIAGFGLGGVLLALVSPRTTLVIGGALAVAAAAVARFGLSRRAPRAAGRPSVRETWRVNRELWASVPRRYVYLALWVPNGLIVGCEALFVPYAPQAAGALFVAGALGMLAGDMAAGLVIPVRLRSRFVMPMRLLLAVPYLLFVLDPHVAVAAVLVAVASAGFGAGVLLQERLIALTGERVRGQAVGLQSAGTMTMQAVGATLAGLLAQVLPVTTAMTVMAAASVVVSVALTRGLRIGPETPEAGVDMAASTPARSGTA